MGKSKKYDGKSMKIKRKEHKEKKKKLKKIGKSKRDVDKKKKSKNITVSTEVLRGDSNDDFSIQVELMNNKSHAPETPEEYQRRQTRIRRELDPVTGRSRLIKGDGEVLEEIVSKDRHKAINKEATKADCDYFQNNVQSK